MVGEGEGARELYTVFRSSGGRRGRSVRIVVAILASGVCSEYVES